MRKILSVLLVLFCLSGAVVAADQESVPEQSGQDASTAIDGAESTAPKEKKHGGYGIFLMVLIVAILYVLSSATALNRLGGKKPPVRGKSKPPKTSNASRKLPEGKERFRL